jgi:hypothetical protein
MDISPPLISILIIYPIHLDVREFSGGDELKEFIKIKRNRRENG